MPSSSLFASVPEVCWELVSSLAAPPDVYNLCLSSKHFHTRPDTDTSEGSPVNKRPRRAAAAKANAKMDDTTPVLATRLLRESLLSSLGRVLKYSESGITLGMFYTYYEQHVLASCINSYERSPLISVPFVPSDALTKLPEGSALIAGSTMVQCCLGEIMKGKYDRPSDVDIYCSAANAPQVRSVSGNP